MSHTAALNPAYLDGYPQGWSVQNVEGQGSGDENLVSGGSAPTSGIASGGAARNNLLAWSFDPLYSVSGAVNLPTGKGATSRFWWSGGTMTYGTVWVTTATTTTTHGWLAVYDSSGTQWAVTADQTTTAFTSTGANKIAFSSATPLPSGWYYGYVAAVYSATNFQLAKFSTTQSATLPGEVNLSAGSWNFAYDSTDSVTTAAPASLVWGTNWAVDYVYQFWFGVS